VYIAFSLLTSWMGEQFNTFLQTRSKMLVAAITQLLTGKPNGTSTAVTQFFADPIFTALMKGGQQNPQYLSAQQFSSIIMGFLNTPAPAANVQEAQAAPDLATAGSPPSNVFARIQANATAIGLGTQIGALIAKANGDYTTFVGAVEDWYDDHMDRVSGWYKVNSQRILLLFGFILAIMWNIDSVRIVRALSCNASIRASAVQLAPQPGGASATNQAVVQSVLDTIPLGWTFTRLPPEQPLSCDVLSGKSPALANDLWTPVSWVVLKLIGLLATGIALSLGAPFWFDTLSQLTRVRQAGKKPDSSSASTAG
jgi:hypothetical protein